MASPCEASTQGERVRTPETMTVFPADYSASALGTLPSGAAPRVCANDGTQSDVLLSGPALLVHVQYPGGDGDWYGQFQGSAAGTGIYGIYHTPRHEDICVVAEGQAYYGPAGEPTCIVALGPCPVVAAHWSVVNNVLALASYSHIVVLAEDGVRKPMRVASDGIRAVTIAHGRITGEGWSAPRDSWERFEIVLREPAL